ncbi:glycosyltransferase family 4 protein [candidate division WOR-3 bacterium]|nr:glycosyltransferase family 4 protein [candidate division WOR-3 bacterium]
MSDTIRPIRVVHYVPTMFGRRFSGQTRWLYTLLSGWQDPDVTLDLWGSELKPVNMNSGNREFQLPSGRNLWSEPEALGRLGLLRQAARVLATLVSRREDFDIVHFHNPWWGELFSVPVLHLLGKRAVYTTSLFGSDDPSAIARSRGALGLALYRRFDGIVALSPALAQECSSHRIANVMYLPNFLAIPELETGRSESLRSAVRARLRIPAEDPVLLFIGSAIRRKGFDVLVESYIRVAQKQPGARLIVVGAKDKTAVASFDVEYVAEQRRKLEAAHVSDRVVWTGMVTDAHELVGYYSAADIFVFPTRREGLGNVLVEAAAAGLPAVVTNLPGITDAVVTDGQNGFLVPPDDAGAVAGAVEQLTSNPSLREKMGAEARTRAQMFEFEPYCHRLKDFYLHVMRTST